LKEVYNNWPEGIKHTKQRECVLTVLEKSDSPLSANDICSRMDTSGSAAWLSTVYRVLELFVSRGMVLKTTIAGSDMALYELNRFKHKHYAVCIVCHKIIAMDNCPMENFSPILSDEGFTVMGHNLEIYGYCRDCLPARLANGEL
jgi:Fur family ferric uptake transcriptional regulator